ncbi:hypothetical protein G9A89_013472 [Geosiphon pyriformis]|nr:hypothetical protein G9A89_013472 [Geosiphon pyriformis]
MASLVLGAIAKIKMAFATVGSVIAIMKKATKVFGSESGFKTIASRKKRKSSVLAKSVDNSKVADKALGNCSWDSEAGNTTESESIDMEEECLVEETSVDYGENSAFAEEDPDQMPKSLRVKTKKVLGKPLSMIDYGTVNIDDDVLDGFFLLPPLLPIKLFIQVPVCKSFALDIDLMAVAEKSSQEKLNFAMMAAAQLANDHGVVVNTNLKCPINNRMNRAIVLKKIPVGTSIEAAIIELEDQIQADLLVAKWSVLIGKNAVHFRALLYTLLMGTTAHDLWNFIGLVGGKTCVIECTRCATVCFDSKSSLIQAMANTPVIKGIGLHWFHLTAALCSICRNSSHTSFACHTASASSSPRSKRASLSAQDQLCLAKIYEKKSVPVSHPLAFSGKTWASVRHLVVQLNLVLYFMVNLSRLLVSSLVSLAGQIGELAKRLDSFVLAVSQPSLGCQLPVTFPSQNQGEDIVMGVDSDDTTSNKTAAIISSTASPEVVKLENMLKGLSALVMSLSAHLDDLALAGGVLPLPLFQ